MLFLLHQHHFLAKLLQYSLDQGQTSLPLIKQNTHTFRLVGVIMRHLDNFECHLLILVSTLPNLGRLRVVMCVKPLFHDTVQLVHCWDGAVFATQRPEFNDGLPLRLHLPICQFLEARSEPEGGRGRELGHLGYLIDASYSIFEVRRPSHLRGADGGSMRIYRGDVS